jgi:short-subunit dehydrogenase
VDWTELTCLVTGASSGIGRAAAHAFASRGARVIAVARRQEKLSALVTELKGDGHFFIKCDVADLEQVRAMAASVAERTDRLDVLLNNAGIPDPGCTLGTTPEEIRRVITTNLIGPIWCLQELHPTMDLSPRTDRTPVVINLASMAGRIPVPRSATYTASKFGLVGFTESLWPELKDARIRTMLVNPGFTHTEGFPMDDLLALPGLRWVVMSPDRVAAAICSGIENGKFEVRVQRWMSLGYYVTLVLGPLRRTISMRARSVIGDVGNRP